MGNLDSDLGFMSYPDFVLHLLEDRLLVETFCQKYSTNIVGVFPNDEVYPPQGLIYVFDGQLGGFSIKGIKNSLEEISEKITDYNK